MILSDADIKRELSQGDLYVSPIDNAELQIQPCTIDLRLDNKFIVFDKENLTHVDPQDENNIYEYTKVETVEDKFIMHPGRFALGATIEKVEVPDYIVAIVKGRSSLGRLAIVIHATAGLCDPGYSGNITLELSNLGSAPIVLRPNMRICQLMLCYLNTPSEIPYGEERDSKYQDQEGPAASKIGQDKEF